MPGVYSLSATIEITFILLKLYLKKLTKKQLNFSFALCEKLSNFSLFLFHLLHPKVLYKQVLLSIITCRHLSLAYHNQKSFIKVFYYLAKTWLCAT